MRPKALEGALAAVALACVASLLACGQLLGVKVFSLGVDGGDDGAAAHDSGLDAVVRGDATRRDAGREAAPTSDAHHADASTLMDAGAEADTYSVPPATCDASLDADPSNCGACGHGCLGGACLGGVCQPVVLASGVGWPIGVAVDDDNVYFTTYGVSGGKGALMKVGKDGGAVVTLASAFSENWSVATDGTYVYWDVHGGSRGVYSVLVTGGGTNALSGPENNPGQLLLDPALHRLYWMNADEPKTDAAPKGGVSVHSMATDGGPVTLLSEDFTAQAAGLLALDSESLFFGAPGTTDLIERIPRTGCDGGGACGEAVIPPDLGGVTALAVDDASLYWAQGGNGPLERDDKDGGGVVVLAPTSVDGGQIVGILPVGSDVFISITAPSGQVARIPKAGVGSLPGVPFAGGLAWPLNLCADDVAVYVVVRGTSTRVDGGGSTFNDSDGKILKVAR